MANGFQVVPTRLLVADVCVDASVSGSACQVLAISEWNVLAIGTFVAFCQPKINDIDRIFGILIAANQKAYDILGINKADGQQLEGCSIHEKIKIENANFSKWFR